ncbi:streptophobe family protein [Streptomyces sp. bgisy022]|uniref:streptophobe family protein n=1 Tax=Streptomyces sp. bgisy022 TaxID=3413769 RepID=UPI003D7429BD
MGAATRAGTAGRDGGRVPWMDVVICAVTAVGWALIGMAGTAALGLHLLDADAAGALGPMTAAVVALGAGGSVTPSADVSVSGPTDVFGSAESFGPADVLGPAESFGPADVSAFGPADVSAFGLSGAEATTAVAITPLGVSLVGALLLALVLLRSLRSAGRGGTVPVAELAARTGAVVVLCAAMAGGLVWAGDDVIVVDGGSLGLGGLPGWDGGGGIDLPGLGDLGEAGVPVPDGAGDLVGAEAAMGYRVDAVPTVLGAALWALGVSAVALAASRRTPLPRGWEAVHRTVRPAVSALVTVLLVAVAAGCAAAGYAAVGDDRPQRIVGAALLGAPNGVWLGLPVGLGVPWDGRASGALLGALPHPLDELLRDGAGGSVTLGRLAELDERVWLLGVASAVAMLLAGVLTAARTPAMGTPAAFAGHCALRLGAATAVALPVLVRLTRASVDASLTVLGFDAFDAGLRLHGDTGTALLLGAAWGAGAGGAGALLARAAGTRAAASAAGGGFGGAGGGAGAGAGATAVGSGGAGGAGGVGGVGSVGGAGGAVVAGGSGQAGWRWSGSSGPVASSGWPRGSGESGRSADGAGYDGGCEAGAAGGASAGPGEQGGAVGGGAGLSGKRREGAGGEGGGRAGSGRTGEGRVTSDRAGEDQVSFGQAGDGRVRFGRAGDGRTGTDRGDAGREGRDREVGVRRGPYTPGTPYRPPNPDTNPYLRMPGAEEPGGPRDARPSDGWPAPADGRAEAQGRPEAHRSDVPSGTDVHGPGAPSWPNAHGAGDPTRRETHSPEAPFLPDAHGTGDPTRRARPRGDGDAGAEGFRPPSWVARPPSGNPRPPGADPAPPEPTEPAPPGDSGNADGSGGSGGSGEADVHGAPTVIRPVEPPRRGQQGSGAARRRSPRRPDDGPPPPPPPPPPAPRAPGGGG